MKKNSHYIPPFELNKKILLLCTKIEHLLGKIDGLRMASPAIKLRKENKIKTIQHSLAIEGNTLTLAQVTALLENKRIVGPLTDIQEVKNAIKVYDNLDKWKPLSISSFKTAHKYMMQGINAEAGMWRTKGVGIFGKHGISHVAPPAKNVPTLMKQLFKFMSEKNDLIWLVKACIFHYELEFIHPFSDGNGRMGRLWQQIMLMLHHHIFAYITVENIIKQRQKEYYAVLSKCDSQGKSTAFIEFSLKTILDAINSYILDSNVEPDTAETRLNIAKKQFRKAWFQRKEYIKLIKTISTATASRDLSMGITVGLLKTQGSQALKKYCFT